MSSQRRSHALTYRSGSPGKMTRPSMPTGVAQTSWGLSPTSWRSVGPIGPGGPRRRGARRAPIRRGARPLIRPDPGSRRTYPPCSGWPPAGHPCSFRPQRAQRNSQGPLEARCQPPPAYRHRRRPACSRRSHHCCRPGWNRGRRSLPASRPTHTRIRGGNAAVTGLVSHRIHSLFGRSRSWRVPWWKARPPACKNPASAGARCC